MSRTKRIYNRKLKKAQRTNLDDGNVHMIIGIPFTRRSQICMGRCPECRDPNKETKTLRKRRKEEFRIQLAQERIGTGEDVLKSTTSPWGLEL